jgi:hypothetical protein
MTGPFATAIIAVSLLLFAWAVVLVVLNRPPGRLLLIGTALLEVMLVAFAVGGIVQMLGTDHDFARLEFVGYLLAVAGVVPAAAWWIRGEESRAGSAVLAVVFALMPVLIVRVQQVWEGAGA